MTCPTCNTDHLLRTEHEGVEIDICTHCGGVWLDKGELETIIARAACNEQSPAHDTARRFERYRRAYDGYFGR